MDPTHEIRGHVTRRAGAPSNFRTDTSFPMPDGDWKIMLVSHGILKKGLKNNLNLLFLYRLGGLKNSTTMKQEPLSCVKQEPLRAFFRLWWSWIIAIILKERVKTEDKTREKKERRGKGRNEREEKI